MIKFLADDNLKPKRGTKASAGYDFILPRDVVIQANGSTLVDTFVRVCMDNDLVLLIYPRSSMGIKRGITLKNTVAVIDADFKDTIKLCLQNNTDKQIILHKGERVAQGIFSPFILVDDDDASETRKGGIGSTDKK